MSSGRLRRRLFSAILNLTRKSLAKAQGGRKSAASNRWTVVQREQLLPKRDLLGYFEKC
jgi:hypothetical protein